MSSIKRRLALALSVLLAGAAISLAVASPAQATAGQCVSYLAGKGYTVDTAIKNACLRGDELGGTRGADACKAKLKQRGGISGTHAAVACARAIA
jgi:hypothetical protein